MEVSLKENTKMGKCGTEYDKDGNIEQKFVNGKWN
jgi:hypothetical protein